MDHHWHCDWYCHQYSACTLVQGLHLDHSLEEKEIDHTSSTAWDGEQYDDQFMH